MFTSYKNTSVHVLILSTLSHKSCQIVLAQYIPIVRLISRQELGCSTKDEEEVLLPSSSNACSNAKTMGAHRFQIFLLLSNYQKSNCAPWPRE